ncbi:TonB-dependent receptor plug domain-containing protein [Salisaeta longa]|uniref:TonB-dependent receptor plug domain-containing protein n=1 Tax=Salisaeta longa TaxID=503170 RepID=UPI0003B79D8A|nr:TonB-dependent receptor [Salisaeta longa]
MRGFLALLLVMSCSGTLAAAQRAPVDTVYADTTRGAVRIAPTSQFDAPLALDEIVVTATRSQTTLANVPVPTQIIGRKDIQSSGAIRLADLLAEQPGLQLSYDHGAGLQVQGLASDYTRILIDGEPVIGRTAGTLNLNRITVADVQRVEIVRGPSSSLYGSDALAGVVNIITRDASGPPEASFHARYGSHGMTDVGVRASATPGPLRAKVFLSHYASNGYDLTPASVAPTMPSFADYIGRTTLRYALGARTTLSVQGRWAHQTQTSRVSVTNETQLFTNDGERTDWLLTPTLTHTRSGVSLEAQVVASGYRTRTALTGVDDGASLSRARFNQQYRKAELQLQAPLGSRHVLTTGGGYIRETVDADRVTGARTGGFFFVQDEWAPVAWLDVVPSARLDAHSDYATRVSPKLALMARPMDGLRLRASVGSGYKAPAFRQLYLNFTNPQVGYTVLGAQEVVQGLARLRAQGHIAALLADPATLGGPIEAERSVAVNVGGGVDLPYRATLRVNLFHNEVRDLIDTQPIARRTNGQQVFTYFNRGRVFTQGIEAELGWNAGRGLDAAFSYTYLNAKDRDVLADLQAGRIYRRTESGRDVPVSPDDYAGLRGRSHHRFTAQLTYRLPDAGFTASVRGRYRGRYGFADRNGNGIVDVAREYAPGYGMLDITLTQSFADHFEAQVGVENATDRVSLQYTPQLSGRTWFVGLRAHL